MKRGKLHFIGVSSHDYFELQIIDMRFVVIGLMPIYYRKKEASLQLVL